MAFGLRQDGVPKAERQERVSEMLKLVALDGYGKRRPQQLSGGQRQRVALARSLVKRPKLLLLDEPLGALDKKLRENTQFELINLQEKLGVTFVIVSHELASIYAVADRVIMLDKKAKGIIAEGRPQDLRDNSKDPFVHKFFHREAA